MKQSLLKFVVLSLVGFFWMAAVAAGEGDFSARQLCESQREALLKFERVDSFDVDGRGIPTCVSGRLGKLVSVDEAGVIDYLNRLLPLFRSGTGVRFEALSKLDDGQGQRHIRLQQTFNGLPVVNAQLTVHAEKKSGEVVAINGGFLPDDGSLPLQPKLDARTAIDRAAAQTGMSRAELLEEPKLSYLLGADGQGYLVWSATIASLDGQGQNRKRIFADAVSGNLVAGAYGWRMPGLARDVAIGGTGASNDDVVWMIEKATPRGRRGGVVCKWIAETNSWKRYTATTAESISVSQEGFVWVMDSDGKPYRHDRISDAFVSEDWGKYRAKDLALGVHGESNQVWFIDRNDGHVYFWVGGQSFTDLEFDKGVAVRIDVDQFERPWVVTDTGLVFFCDTLNTSKWLPYSTYVSNGRTYTIYAKDIGADLNGWEVWIAPARPTEIGKVWHCNQPDADPDTPDNPPYWWSGPYAVAHRIDYSEGEIIIAKSNGEIWWIPLR